jgi:DNA uptake protein ComE-like DNA-binding protein
MLIGRIVAAGLFLASCLFCAELPDGPAKDIILHSCTGCHAADSMSGYKHTKEEWQAIVSRMGERAPSVSKDDLDTIAAYLFKNFPTVEDASKLNVNKATAKELVDGMKITEKEAEAIVHYREQHELRVWGDMLVIYGLDGRKVEAVKDLLAF